MYHLSYLDIWTSNMGFKRGPAYPGFVIKLGLGFSFRNFTFRPLIFGWGGVEGGKKGGYFQK